MRRFLVSSLILGSFAATGAAQNEEPHNYTRGTRTNWVIRNSAAGGFYAGRFADEAVRGLPPVVGGRVRVYDFVSSTADTFNLILFEETASGSHTPKSTPTFDIGPTPLVTGWVAVKLAGPPVFIIPPGIDIWLGTKMINAFSTGNDGGYQYFLRGDADSTGLEDIPGRRIPNTGIPLAERTYLFGSTSPSTGSVMRTFYSEPLHTMSGGVGAYAVAKTNQTDQTGLSGDQIIGGFNSGEHPDVTGHNTGRQDDFGFEVQGSLAVNMPVVFFVAAQYGPNIPLNIGVFCLDLGTMIPLGVVVGDSLGMATLLLPNALGQSLVAKINNPDIFWGAVIVDAQKNQLIGTPCARQRL